MIEFFKYLGGNINFLYLYVLEFLLFTGTLALAFQFFKHFKLIPIFRSYQGYFWLLASFYWFLNIIEGILILKSYDIAIYFSYISFFFLLALIVIAVTFLLGALLNHYKFPPLIFVATLLSYAIFAFIAFLQKDLFILEKNAWINHYVFNYEYQNWLLYAILGPVSILTLFLLIKSIYYMIKKRFSIFEKLNIYITFSFLLYLTFLSLFYTQYFYAWKSIVILLLTVLAPLFSYLLLVDTGAYQEDIINPQASTDNVVKIPLIFKFLLGELFAISIPLFLANLIIFTFYKLLTGVSLFNSQSDLFKHLIILDLFILIFALAFNIIMTKRIISRIFLLIKATKEVQRSNLTYQIPVKGHDELTALTISFNDMINNLKKYKNELRNYSLVLEEEIEKQTLELRQKRHEAEVLAEQNMTLYKQLQKQTSTIIDNITDFLIALDHNNNIMTINKLAREQFFAEQENVLGENIDNLEFFHLYKLDKIIENFREKHLEKYNFKLHLTKPYYKTLDCYLSQIDLGEDKIGILLIMRDISPPWGTVLDSETYEPINLAVVRLFDNSNNKLLETAVTDENGRFGFFVKPGSYYMTVTKEGYHFPSQAEAGYHGELIQVRTKEEGIIKVNILLDPLKKVRTGIESGLDKMQENASLTEKFESVNKTSMPQSASDSLVADVNLESQTKETNTVQENLSLSSLAEQNQISSEINNNLEGNNTVPKQNIALNVGKSEQVNMTNINENMNVTTEENLKQNIDNQTTTGEPTTAISERALKAREAKKRLEGNVNPEEKPGQMLKQIKHMIDETKKITGTETKDDTSVLETIEEESEDLSKDAD